MYLCKKNQDFKKKNRFGIISILTIVNFPSHQGQSHPPIREQPHRDRPVRRRFAHRARLFGRTAFHPDAARCLGQGHQMAVHLVRGFRNQLRRFGLP